VALETTIVSAKLPTALFYENEEQFLQSLLPIQDKAMVFLSNTVAETFN